MQPFLLVPALLVLFALHVQAFGSTKPKLNSVEKFKEAMTAFASELVGPAEPEKLMGSAGSPDVIQQAASIVFSPSAKFNDNALCETSPQGVCQEECKRFKSSSQCTRNGDTEVFLQDVASCSECKRCLRNRGRISGSCPQVCDCYNVPMDVPEWCWWDSLTGNWCTTDMFRSPAGKQTCDKTTPSGWRAERGNWDMTNCAFADRCGETIEHSPKCWYDTSGSHNLCYTEDRWRPNGDAWTLSEQDGRMDNCIKWNAEPCGAVRFDPELSCVDETRKLSQNGQLAQRVHRATKEKKLCGNKPVGPYYMDDAQANAPNDLQYSGEWKTLTTCYGSGHACSFGQFNSCYKDAAMMTKGECAEYGIQSDYNAICMIGARCAINDITRGFCPPKMHCTYDEEQNLRFGTAGKATSGVSTGVCMFADGIEVGTFFLYLGIAIAGVLLVAAALPLGLGALSLVASTGAIGSTAAFNVAAGVTAVGIGAGIGVGSVAFVGGVAGAIVSVAQTASRRLDTPLLLK